MLRDLWYGMKIKSIHVKNFRCLQDVVLPCDNLTILVGRNGVGKSCLLTALNLFYKTDIRVDKQDYYNEDTSNPISITVRFSDLTELERKLFRPYLEGDELSIEKVMTYDPSKPIQKYYGARYQNPEFEAFRKAVGQDLRREYNRLKEKKEYSQFPSYQNKDLAQKVLEEWELSNKGECKQFRDDGQFFGFQNVGKHRMEKYTKFIHIPAVQEASEESMEGARRGSLFEEIMGIVVKGTLAANKELVQLQIDAEKKYRELINPAENKDLIDLEKELTETLNYYVSDSKVNIQWIEEEGVEINPPRAYVTLSEGGYQNTVDRCGHGLQRAYILSLFQQLALIQASIYLENEKTAKSSQLSLPSLIIGIEEPELYQHPDRLRHFAKTLLDLSSRKIEGTVENVQIVYSTHAPLLIDFQRFNQLRIFRKIHAGEEDKPQRTQITCTNLDRVARFIEKAKELDENTISNEALRQRLIPLMTPWMNEGFFAKLVVLVEGIRDRALILGDALSKDIDFESMGICIIPCSGKNAMTEAIAIYRCFEIPTYVVWDSDVGDEDGIPANKNIMRCHGVTPEDYPCMTTADFCCLKTDLEQTFREEVGLDNYSRIVSGYCKEKDVGKARYVMENPYIVSEIITLLEAEHSCSSTLKEIVDRIAKKYNAVDRSIKFTL